MPAVAVTGFRQSGKTTLCRGAFPVLRYVSLEPLDTREFATADPRGFLREFGDGVILDKVQRVPTLFPYLQEELDRDPTPGRFVLTRSSPIRPFVYSTSPRRLVFVLMRRSPICPFVYSMSPSRVVVVFTRWPPTVPVV